MKGIMIVCVSGTPGTGKTTFAKDYAKKNGFEYISLNDLIDKKNLSEGIDEKRGSKIIDVRKLNREIKAMIGERKGKAKGLVLDGHLSHYLPKSYVDKVFITKCELKTLKSRLTKRGYSEEKIRENMDAEIFDVCRVEAIEAGHAVETISTD